MKYRYTTTLLITASLTLQAQVFDWAGQMGYNGNQNGQAIVVDDQGNVFHAGYFIAGIDLDPTAGVDTVLAIGGQDGYLVKQDNDGNYVWGAHFRGNCLPNALALTTAGNILVVGTFTGTVDMDPGVGVANVTAPASLYYFLCCLAPDGTYLWSKSFGCGQPVYDPAVAIGNDGNIHLTGVFTNTMDADPGDGPGEVFDLTSNGGNDVFITTLDPQGEFIRSTSFGDIGDDRGHGIAVDAANNVYVTGYFAGDITIDPNGANITLSNVSGASYCDVFTLKLNPSGTAEWAFSFGGPGYDRGLGITVNAAQEVYVAGGVASAADLDPGPGTFLNTGSDSPFYAKYDANGSFMHAALAYYNNLSDARAFAIALDATGRIFLAGKFNGYAVDFDPGPGSTNYDTNGNSEDGFISVYAAVGTYLWSRQLGGINSSQEVVQSMTVDAAGSCYMTGSFSGPMDFDPGAGQFIQTPIAAGYFDGFVLKLDPSDLGVENRSYTPNLRVYPTPTEGVVTVEVLEGKVAPYVTVRDAAGRSVKADVMVQVDRVQVDLSNAAPGIYFVEMSTDGHLHRVRAMRQ